MQSVDRVESTLQSVDHVESTLQSVDHVESTLQSVDHVESTLQSVDRVESKLYVKSAVVHFQGVHFLVFQVVHILGFPGVDFSKSLVVF